MTNILGVPAFGGGGFAIRQPPDPPKPAVPQIAETALNGTATYTKGTELPGQNGEILSYKIAEPSEIAEEQSATMPDTAYNAAYNKAQQDPESPAQDLSGDILTGPTPAFQASVLEVELDLRNAIAEIAAKRMQSADEAAIAPTRSRTDTPEPAAKDAETAETRLADQAAEAAKAQTMALSEPPSEATDPEIRHAGPAALQRTPFDPG